jgi:pantoate--beta-alanine ligase
MRAALLHGDPVATVEGAARNELAVAGLVVDYAVVRHADDLREVAGGQGERVALIAARMGSTRLIDNLMIDA